MIFQQLHIIWKYVQKNEGQDLTEYALLMVFLVLVVIAAVTAFGNTLPSLFDSATTALGG